MVINSSIKECVELVRDAISCQSRKHLSHICRPVAMHIVCRHFQAVRRVDICTFALESRKATDPPISDICRIQLLVAINRARSLLITRRRDSIRTGFSGSHQPWPSKPSLALELASTPSISPVEVEVICYYCRWSTSTYPPYIPELATLSRRAHRIYSNNGFSTLPLSRSFCPGVVVTSAGARSLHLSPAIHSRGLAISGYSSQWSTIVDKLPIAWVFCFKPGLRMPGLV